MIREKLESEGCPVVSGDTQPSHTKNLVEADKSLVAVEVHTHQSYEFVFFPFIPVGNGLDPGLMGPVGAQAGCSPIPLPTLAHTALMLWILTSLTMTQGWQLPLVTYRF